MKKHESRRGSGLVFFTRYLPYNRLMRNTVDLRKREADTKPEPKQKKEKQEKSNDILISWQAPEYEYTKKHRDWYWAVGIITVAFAVVGVLIQNILFVILIILAGFTVALYGARKPRIADFVLTARGIKIGERFYPYDSLKSFWINYDPPGKKEIIFVSSKTDRKSVV